MKHFSLLLTLLMIGTAFAAPVPPREMRPGTKIGKVGKGKRNRTPNIWHVFSQLPISEQKEMMKLQRTSPEKFRTIMQEKAVKFQAEQQAKRKQLNELAEKIRNSKDDREKAELRSQLRAKVKESFDNRIAQFRRNIESNKKRLERMENDLKRREDNAEAIVDAITDSMISGKRRQGGRRHGKRPPDKP